MSKKMINYNDEPVTYCARCYSLKIAYENSIGMDCCGECGCTDTRTASFNTWEELFKRRYGHKYVQETKDIRRSPIFLMTEKELKQQLYKSSHWKEICKTLYPNFPDGISRADSVILLFAKLCQDNRMDDLRIELINSNKKDN